MPPELSGLNGAAMPHSLVADPRADAILIRPIVSREEFRACVALQCAVWGTGFTDSVPASLLQVATYVGGLVLGAFSAGDVLAGFVFGLTGVKDGQVVHWSHLLAVRDEARNLGVGRRLKEAQRTALAAIGVERTSWSFDPLVAKNAHLNLNRLGARVSAYVPNMYGTMESDLHFGLATDRLVVTCVTDSTPRPLPANVSSFPVLTTVPGDSDVLLDTSIRPRDCLIEIPTDFFEVVAHAPDTAVAWRDRVRADMQWALAQGCDVIGIHRDVVTSRTFYVLQQPNAV